MNVKKINLDVGTFFVSRAARLKMVAPGLVRIAELNLIAYIYLYKIYCIISRLIMN